jgi:hypothetical protein
VSERKNSVAAQAAEARKLIEGGMSRNEALQKVGISTSAFYYHAATNRHRLADDAPPAKKKRKPKAGPLYQAVAIEPPPPKARASQVRLVIGTPEEIATVLRGL